MAETMWVVAGIAPVAAAEVVLVWVVLAAIEVPTAQEKAAT
jgi:hypothetical protein